VKRAARSSWRARRGVTERLGPPHDLNERELPIVRLEGPWLRLHAAGREPVFFGRTGLNRFDDPEGEYGVLYARRRRLSGRSSRSTGETRG
jgi:hypothetical protein